MLECQGPSGSAQGLPKGETETSDENPPVILPKIGQGGRFIYLVGNYIQRSICGTTWRSTPFHKVPVLVSSRQQKIKDNKKITRGGSSCSVFSF